MFQFPWEDDELLESRALRHIAEQNEQILANQETIMATAQQLSDALASTQNDLNTLLAAGVGGVPEAELDPILAAVQQLDAAIVAAIPPAPQP